VRSDPGALTVFRAFTVFAIRDDTTVPFVTVLRLTAVVALKKAPAQWPLL
jgi:hypothetical protein